MLSITIAGEYFTNNISIPDEFTPIEIPLFISINNDRIYYEQSDRYETFKHYISRKFRKIKLKLKLNQIKFLKNRKLFII